MPLIITSLRVLLIDLAFAYDALVYLLNWNKVSHLNFFITEKEGAHPSTLCRGGWGEVERF